MILYCIVLSFDKIGIAKQRNENWFDHRMQTRDERLIWCEDVIATNWLHESISNESSILCSVVVRPKYFVAFRYVIRLRHSALKINSNHFCNITCPCPCNSIHDSNNSAIFIDENSSYVFLNTLSAVHSRQTGIFNVNWIINCMLRTTFDDWWTRCAVHKWTSENLLYSPDVLSRYDGCHRIHHCIALICMEFMSRRISTIVSISMRTIKSPFCCTQLVLGIYVRIEIAKAF